MRLRAAEIQIGDRLRYTLGKGVAATVLIVRVDGIEGPSALVTREDTDVQMIVRLGDLARNSKRLRTLTPA